MPLYVRHSTTEPLVRPTVVAALDGWVDAGGAASAAAARLAADSELVATFDADTIFDFRARRPTLIIENGQARHAHLARAHRAPPTGGRTRHADPRWGGARLPLAHPGG